MRKVSDSLLQYIMDEIQRSDMEKISIDLSESSDKIDVVTEVKLESKENLKNTIKEAIENTPYGRLVIFNKNKNGEEEADLDIKSVKRQRFQKESDRVSLENKKREMRHG